MEDERNESLVPEFGKDLDAENNQGSGNNQESGKGRQLADNMKDKAKDKVKDKGKDAAKKAAKKAAKEGAKKGAAKVAMGPVIFWGTVIIVALIIIIGIIMFFVTMPGMVMEKLKELFKELGDAVAAFFGADVTERVPDNQIYETLAYLEEMGYDLKGFGFLHGYYTDSDEDKEKIEEQLSDEQKKAGYKVDKMGVVRESGGDNRIILAKSDYIFTYIVSENYAYTLKNHNLATKGNNGGGLFGFVQDVIDGIKGAAANIIHFFGLDALTQSVFKMFGVHLKMPYDEWGKGFLGIYKEDGELLNDGTIIEWDSLKIDIPRRILSIERTDFLNGNNPMEYSLDGWTGRYSMPIDFLLSVHIATMMPDLAYDMATGFATEARLFLHKAEGEVIAAYKTTNGTYETYGSINSAINQGEGRNIFSLFFSWIDSWYTNDDEMKKAQELGIRHTPDCEAGHGCTYTEEKAYQIMVNGRIRQVIKNEGAYAKAYEDCEDLDSSKAYYIDTDMANVAGKSVEDLYKAGLLKEVPQESEKFIQTIPDESHKVYTEYCSACRSYIDKVIDVLRDVNDYSYCYYIPYLKDVTDHWYRDVYFMTSKDNQQFVTVDTDYEAIYKERWTLYEVYEESDTNEYAKEHLGDFKLYLINTDTIGYEGKYETTAALSLLYPQEAIDKLVREGEYWLFLGSKEEATDLGIKVAKKAKMTNGSGLKDYGWVKEDGEWSAYKFTSSTKQAYYTPAYTKEKINDESDKEKQSIMRNIYMKLESNANVIQVGEGMRSATNPKIKNMFLNNTYFRYDGTARTAEIITGLRDQICGSLNDGIIDEWYNREEPVPPYGAINKLRDHNGDLVGEDYLNAEYELTIDGETDKYNVADYSGQVLISQDSLNAFSMLENSHTLDADFIYRDFKELIVELGYFAKEELTDEVPEILGFPVADIGSYQYPDRTIDKRENEYGTMVHSAGDIAANKAYSGKEDEINTIQFGYASEYDEEEAELREQRERKMYQGYKGNEAVVAPVTGILLEYGTYDGTMIDTITEEPYRVNVDLKYGPVALQKAQSESEDEDAEEYEGPVVSDKVGYAKILVLDTENYLKLERSLDNMWFRDGKSLYNENTGKYENPLVGNDVANGGTSAETILNGWHEDDKTVYGYKEFAELYKTTGISGYVLVIDGFVCEEPDSSLMKHVTGKIPAKGSPITMDSYKANRPLADRMTSAYYYIDKVNPEPERLDNEKRVLTTVTATDKLHAENLAKEAARSTYYLESEDLIFIKEGTVLGRTMTDDELKNSSSIRSNTAGINYDETGIVGNYIRVILRDLDTTPVENIEDMMKKSEIYRKENRDKGNDN